MNNWHFIFTFKAVFFLAACSSNEPIYVWHFDENTGDQTEEEVTSENYTIHSNGSIKKWGTGIEGSALRLDGNSTYLEGQIAFGLPIKFTAVGWFALEVYPVDTITIIAFSNEDKSAALKFGLDKLGFPLVISTGTGSNIIKGNKLIEKSVWNQFVLARNTSVLQLFLNGEFIGESKIAISENELDHFIFGKRPLAKQSTKQLTITDINCLLDEIEIWDFVFGKKQVKAEFEEDKPVIISD